MLWFYCYNFSINIDLIYYWFVYDWHGNDLHNDIVYFSNRVKQFPLKNLYDAQSNLSTRSTFCFFLFLRGSYWARSLRTTYRLGHQTGWQTSLKPSRRDSNFIVINEFIYSTWNWICPTGPYFLLSAHIVWGTKQESWNVQSSAHSWGYVQVSLALFLSLSHTHWLKSLPTGTKAKYPLLSFTLFFSVSLKCIFLARRSGLQSFWNVPGCWTISLACLSSSLLQWWPPAALCCNAACHWSSSRSFLNPSLHRWPGTFAARLQLTVKGSLGGKGFPPSGLHVSMCEKGMTSVVLQAVLKSCLKSQIRWVKDIKTEGFWLFLGKIRERRFTDEGESDELEVGQDSEAAGVRMQARDLRRGTETGRGFAHCVASRCPNVTHSWLITELRRQRASVTAGEWGRLTGGRRGEGQGQAGTREGWGEV